MSRSPNLHHAYLVVGSLEEAEKWLYELFGPLKGSPDFFIFKNETFGIDEARDLSTSAVRRAFTNKKVYLIAPVKFSIEAQNALLKTFEDPIRDTHFFIVVKNEELIIPTLRSRMEITRVKHRMLDMGVEQFLKLPLKDQLVFAKKFADDERDLSDFLDELMLVLKSSTKSLELEQVYKLRSFAGDRSVAPRLILEHLALVL